MRVSYLFESEKHGRKGLSLTMAPRLRARFSSELAFGFAPLTTI